MKKKFKKFYWDSCLDETLTYKRMWKWLVEYNFEWGADHLRELIVQMLGFSFLLMVFSIAMLFVLPVSFVCKLLESVKVDWEEE